MPGKVYKNDKNDEKGKKGKKGKISVDVFFTPQEELPVRDLWIVIDLLRATTLCSVFFNAGGEILLPVAGAGDALELKKRLGGGWLLAGERGGVPPAGFDTGNSPSELYAAGLGGRHRGIISTSNGTRALLRASEAGGTVFAASAVCASAVCGGVFQNFKDAGSSQKAENGGSIGILCSGGGGRPCLEDILCAGLLVDKLVSGGEGFVLKDGALISRSLFNDNKGLPLYEAVRRASHASYLDSIGYRDDVRFCSEVDSIGKFSVLSRWEGYPVLIPAN